jgi:hypothetical protein
MDEFRDAHFVRQLIKSLALYYLRTGIGEEAFALIREMTEDDVADTRSKNGIAEKFQTFVVHYVSVVVPQSHTLMQQGTFVILYPVWEISCYRV